MTDKADEQFAQINTKLDVLISQHGTTARRVDDHETRIRETEARQVATDERVKELTARDADQEERIRMTDRWRYAMPITGAGVVGALLAGAAALITALGQ